MDQAERAVAVARPLVAGALDGHAHRGQVVDLVELATLLGHLVVDRIEVLRAARDLGRDVDLLQLGAENLTRLLDRSLAVGAAVGDHRLDLGVLARVQDLERAVLELPLHRVDPEPVRERRVDLERLLRLAHLGLLALVLDRPHVVEPVGELDQDHADVLRHRHDHLAVVLGVGLLARLEARPGQLGDALDELSDLVAELGAQVVRLDVGVLDDVVQQRRSEGGVVEMELGADLRDRPRVVHERLAGASRLALVRRGGKPKRPSEELLVDARVVLLDRRNQLVDQVLVMTFDVDYRHQPSVLAVSAANLPRRSTRCKGERCRPCLSQIAAATARHASSRACSRHWTTRRALPATSRRGSRCGRR